MALALFFRFGLGQTSSDFDQIVIGARRALSGLTPYTPVPLPGLEWPIYYPMPALLLGLPFVALPLAWGQAIFCGISAGCFAWALSADGDAKLFALASWPYVLSVSLGQWGPLLMATAGLPMLAWLVLAKPNIGLALAVAYGSSWVRGRALWVNLAMAAMLVTGSFVLRPAWVGEWRSTVAAPTPHILVPLTVLGGPLLLLALLRWRRPEARLLASLACVPQTFSSYDALLLFLVPKTRREGLLLVAATTVVTAIIGVVGPAPSYAGTVHKFAALRIALVYLPALAMVLVRPNHADFDSKEE